MPSAQRLWRVAPLLGNSEAAAADQDLNDAIKFTESGMDIYQSMTKRLKKLPPPARDEDELDGIYDFFLSGIAAGLDGIEILRRSGSTEAAHGRFLAADRLGETGKRLAEEYGFETCGQPPQ